MEVADLLTLSQLAELAATPSQLKTMQQVTKIMAVTSSVDFGAFFDIVSPAIEVNFYKSVTSLFLAVILTLTDYISCNL